MPPKAVKTIQDLLFWQYAKIISQSAGYGKKQFGFVMNRFKKLSAGEMEKGARIISIYRWGIPQAVTLAKKGDFFGDKIVPFHCKKCGYIELYKTPPFEHKIFLKNCVKCGREIPIASEESSHCGAKQPEYEEP